MQTSQTLINLANSAKRNQDEFNNTLIEIHKQSASKIEKDLRILYQSEMNTIEADTKKTLEKMLSTTIDTKAEIINQMAPSLTQKIFNGIVLSIAMIFLILGFLACFWLNRNEIEYYQAENERLRAENNTLSEWQIPADYRYTQQNNQTQKTERYLYLPPQTLTQKRDGSQYLRLYGGF